MPAFHLGIVSGLVCGALSALVVFFLPGDKRISPAGAFFLALAIAVSLGFGDRGRLGWGPGIVIGLLISLPAAILSKAYAKVLALGVANGTLIGWLLGRFGS
jgi:hypothetical protein